MKLIKLPAGKYIVKVHVPTYRQSWRDLPHGGVQRPRVVTAHWREVCLKSDEPITITPC